MKPSEAAVLKRLRDVFAGSTIARVAVLFGSRAAGTARDSSDFDIGILPREPGLSLRDELGLAATLSSVVAGEVDLVRLDGDDPLLGREVAQRGICLFEAEPGMFAAYRASAASQWLDFEETSAPHRRSFLRRLAGA
jgi:predicted nucleotidyltransferase